MIQNIDNNVNANNILISQQLQDEYHMPKLFILIPPTNSIRQMISKWKKPSRWLCSKYKLYFICPVTGIICNTNDGKGYSLYLPQTWISEYGEAIKFSLQCLVLLNDIISSMIPLCPTIFSNELKTNIESALSTPNLLEFINEIDLALNNNNNNNTNQKMTKATGACYRALSAIINKDIDPNLLKTGCEKVIVNNKGENSCIEWVSPGDGINLLKEKGKEAIKISNYYC